jgi:hypothetical protein
LFTFIYLQEVSEDLKNKVQKEVPENPIYITFENGKVVIPEVVFRHVSAPAKPERKGQIQFVCTENDTPQKQDKPVQSITEEMNQNQETQKESLDTHNEDCMQDNFELEELDESDDKIARFDWKYLYNKHLLGILKVKKERKTNFSKNMWNIVAEEMKEKLGIKKPT